MMQNNPLLSGHWYYKIEVEKGVFTKGLEHQNLAITRKLLRNVQIQNKTCVDIGTQEAVIPILLKKAGAKIVVGYDRIDLTQKIKMLTDAYQVDFEYIGGIQLQELPKKLDQHAVGRFFDLVVFSGVLYHMINPLGLMALVRGLCKAGGLFLIETVAIQHPKEMLIFNAGGKIYGPGSNYFVPTTAWLDYALRMLGLMPLHAVYLGEINNERPIRLAILCRSQDSPCPLEPGDDWMLKHFHGDIFDDESQFNWERLKNNRGVLDYTHYDSSVIELINKSLYAELHKHPRYIPQINENTLTLESQM